MLAQKSLEIAELFPAESKRKWDTKELVKAIHRSQKSQRNFDRSKTIPSEDLKTIITAATHCPSKGNVAFYNLHVITNHDLIDEVYKTTTNIGMDDEKFSTLSNPQTLGNLLLVFEQNPNVLYNSADPYLANSPYVDDSANNDTENQQIITYNAAQAVGVAAGYVNIISTLLGYETGCCNCVMDRPRLTELLNLKSNPLLLMGVGFGNEGVNRKVHQLKGTEIHAENNWQDMFRARPKQNIKLNFYK